MNREPEHSQHSGSRSIQDKIRYEYDEHYFLTDPDEFIMEFWAQEPKWQLLESPISLDEFVSMPFVRSIFFHNGLEFADSKRAVLETNTQGGVEVNLLIPNELREELVFHYHLRFADRDKRKETHFNGISLERHVFHTITDQLALFSVHVPIPGHYFIEIFVNKVEELRNLKFNGSENQTSWLQSFRLKCAAKLRIVCGAISSKMIPLPLCAPGEWGPLKARRYFGIVCLSHQVGVINATEEIKILFQLKKMMILRAEMVFNGIEKRDLDGFVSVSIDKNLVATVRAVFPRKGQFGIDLYGIVDDMDDPSGTLTHICKFLVNCTQVSKPVSLSRSTAADLLRQSSMIESRQVHGRTVENEYTLPASLPMQPPMVGGQSYTESYENAQNHYAAAWTMPVTSKELYPLEDNIPTPGPTPAFHLYGVRCLSHKYPEISDFDKRGSVSIEMGCSSSDFKLIPKMMRDSPKENWTHQVSTKDSSKKFRFQVTLPRYGRFWLTISAVNKNEPQSRQSEVYTYLLNYVEGTSVKRKTNSLRK